MFSISEKVFITKLDLKGNMYIKIDKTEKSNPMKNCLKSFEDSIKNRSRNL